MHMLEEVKKRAFNPLELELQLVVSCLVWVSRTKLQSSVRTDKALNY